MTESAIGLRRGASRGRAARVRSPCARCGAASVRVCPSERLLSQEAVAPPLARVFLVFLAILISLTHELWRFVQVTSGFSGRIVPCVPGSTGSLFFRWSMNLFPLAQDPLDLFRLDVCVYSRIAAHLTLFDFHGACLMNEPLFFFFIELRDCTVSDLHCGKTAGDWCENPPLKYVLREPWSSARLLWSCKWAFDSCFGMTGGAPIAQNNRQLCYSAIILLSVYYNCYVHRMRVQ